MSDTFEKNIYGLSEGVFKACQFLGLKFPSEVPKELDPSAEHVPSDYFGDDFELDAATMKKLRSERKWTEEKLQKEYAKFSKKYFLQRCFKLTKTDMNVYFCDYLLFAAKQNGVAIKNYFYFAFYKKSFALRSTFFTQRHKRMREVLSNDRCSIPLLRNKANANELFANFIHRDWLNTRKCSFEEFRLFVEKYPKFFSKPIAGDSGTNAQIIHVDSNQNLNKLFEELTFSKSILEEVIVQHEDLAAFCPDTTNTLRICTFLDVHNVVHILTASGRFGRMGTSIDNFTRGGYSVIVDPKSGIITSDGMNNAHEFFQKHPDSGKIFKGFQYPSWEKLRATVITMAKLVPQIRHIGWDITINNKTEIVFVEANDNADVNIQQAPDDTGRLHLYKPLLKEIRNYKREQMKLLGWRVNNLPNFRSAYEIGLQQKDTRFPFAISKLIPDCASLMDVGCRKDKFLKTITPPPLRIIPSTMKRTTTKSLPAILTKIFPILKSICVSAHLPPSSWRIFRNFSLTCATPLKSKF